MKIKFHNVINALSISVPATLDTFSRPIHFKLIHSRVITNKIIFKMHLAHSFTCLFCNREELVI